MAYLKISGEKELNLQFQLKNSDKISSVTSSVSSGK